MAVDDPMLGATLPGNFRIDAPVAHGSFGVVYRARQLTVDRDVALKIMRDSVDPVSEDGRLFVQEIQAVARIDHPNVVRVYQADVTGDGRLFFAMEWLAGRDLQAVLREDGGGAIAPARAVLLVRQLLAALDAAHRAGIVHADVKPGNAILVDGPAGDHLVLVDFGLARLRQLGPAVSLGGTPAFMAPEQLRAGRVDARSDQFSAALVLVLLLAGWHRKRASELAPPDDVLAGIADAAVRAALRRALSIAPDERFASAADFATALAGEALAAPTRPPFHGLASFTESDRGHLHGRDREVAQLAALVLYRRLVVITAPSGVGKTSLLRAGLVPRLEALGNEARYASCRSDGEAMLAGAVGERDPARPLIVLVDQVEAALDGSGSTGASLLSSALELGRHRDAAIHVALSVREDFLARLLDRLPERGDGAPIVRIGPLDEEGARDAIARPLAERGLVIEPELLSELLADLTAAGNRLGAELGWSATAPVYPPHLQLACAMLHDRLAPGATTLTAMDYRALGGFDAIVGEHLERVLGELTPQDAEVARELFLALVSVAQLRSARTDAELADAVAEAPRARVPAVLEILQRQGLVVRTPRPGGELAWELIHDSLVPRVLSWIDRRDLSRRRAVELVRHHLHRSRPEAPSLLSRAELREVSAHADAIAGLEAEWQRRHPDGAGWTPGLLIARSRQVQRRSTAALVALAGAVVAGAIAVVVQRQQAAAERAAETKRRDADLGLVTLELSAFDWSVEQGKALPVALTELPELSWTLHAPALDDAEQPGAELPAEVLRLPGTYPGERSRRVDMEVRGGPAFLVVTGRGRGRERCGRSVVPLGRLPGYASRGASARILRVHVPTCQATYADTIRIPAGPFWFGGLGDPPAEYQRESPERLPERLVTLPAYRIDRTEVLNAAYAVFVEMHDVMGTRPRVYMTSVNDLSKTAEPRSPASGVTWDEARAYCDYLGKHLPSSEEWEKALRGAATPDNAWPKRNFPWGTAAPTATGDYPANLAGRQPAGVALAGSVPADVSPYGVVDLAGNVSEWISEPTGVNTRAEYRRNNWRVIRGGNWNDSHPEDLLKYVPIENTRYPDNRQFSIGFRCAAEDGVTRVAADR